MKKFIGLITILLLLAFPILSPCQNSDVADLHLNYTILGGCVIELSVYEITWSAITIPILGDEFVSSDAGMIDVFVGAKIDAGHTMILSAESGVFERISDQKPMSPEMFFQAIFSGDVVGTFPFPAVGDAPQELWSIATSGRWAAQLDCQYFNMIAFGSPGDWTGTYILTVSDIITP